MSVLQHKKTHHFILSSSAHVFLGGDDADFKASILDLSTNMFIQDACLLRLRGGGIIYEINYTKQIAFIYAYCVYGGKGRFNLVYGSDLPNGHDLRHGFQHRKVRVRPLLHTYPYPW